MRFLLALAAIGLVGCGYPADPLPPALNRPTGITDLSAVERGSKIFVHYTRPAETTEGLPIKGTPDVELRVGILPESHFETAAWEQNSERITGTDFDASKYYTKTLVMAVRVRGPHGRNAGWSNFVLLPIVPALAAPEGLEAKNAPDAISLEWHGAAPAFRVFRKLPDQKDWTLLSLAPKSPYLDNTIDYGKTYEYRVQAVEKTGDTYAESEISASVSLMPVDTFPPSVPTGLTTVPGTRTIELLWDRNVEKDIAGYRVYRDTTKVADALVSPSFSDKDVKAGVRYSYSVTAIDNVGNESAHAPAVEAVIP